jgi:hypothetical protein
MEVPISSVNQQLSSETFGLLEINIGRRVWRYQRGKVIDVLRKLCWHNENKYIIF